MITVENHFDVDELWIMDDSGASGDLQVLIQDHSVFLSQLDEEAGMQVIQLTVEQFANIFVAMQLPQGVYDVDGKAVKVQ